MHAYYHPPPASCVFWASLLDDAGSLPPPPVPASIYHHRASRIFRALPSKIPHPRRYRSSSAPSSTSCQPSLLSNISPFIRHPSTVSHSRLVNRGSLCIEQHHRHHRAISRVSRCPMPTQPRPTSIGFARSSPTHTANEAGPFDILLHRGPSRSTPTRKPRPRATPITTSVMSMRPMRRALEFGCHH